MLDIKLIREQTELVKENLSRRGEFDLSIVDKLKKEDEKWREIKKELDRLKSQKNKENQKINEIKKSGKDIKFQIEKIKKLTEDIKKKEEEEKESLLKRDEYLIKLPNMLNDEVPFGKDDSENVPIKTWGDKPKFDFEPKGHQEICEKNDWIEIDKASKTSGARFYYLKNELVLLEIAIYNYAMQKIQKKGYCPVSVPHMLRREMIGKSVSLEDFEDMLYKIEGEDKYLIATSEHSLAVLHNDEKINYRDLPKKYAGISPCYRKEAGVTKDSKGFFRVHHFNKIEQFIFCRKEDSENFHKEILKNTEELFQDLGLHYQIVDICTGDIGSFACRKYDLEAWFPTQNKFREMASASNYKDYGARRLNLKYEDEKNNLEFCHTLNNTYIALQRTIIAIIEQYQTKTGDVIIPEVLRSYFGGRELLKK
jgi:seryl-tRNA synthetase